MMNNDKMKMTIVAIVTCLCAVWALFIKDLGMLVLLSFATIIDFYISIGVK